MNKKQRQPGDKFSETVGAKEVRKIKARREKERVVWFGLGMFGVIGWSVVIPTLLGIGLGIWIDIKWPSRYSWTLMLLIIGVILGCLNAWLWIVSERKMINKK
ncbi:MAG: ATP synthase protein I [Desulfobacteraceae bacterium Eth-SRB1]|nr:MAG: ATP synthase protein I [Desulfobacteraceae bacterium Eth-SRB1]